MTIRPRQKKQRFGAARIVLLSVPFVIFAFPSLSAEIPADLNAYCAGIYGAGTEGGIDRRDNGPLCTERTHGGLGLLHHKIDPAAVCSSQHQTGNYRKEGGGLMCLTDDGSQSESKTVDLADYCRRNHGEAAIVSRRLADNRPLCTVKGDGGLSQTHHAIDTAALCGGGGGSVDGDTLDCNAAPGAGQKAASDADNQPGKPEKQANQPGGEPRNGSDGGSAGTAGDVRIYSRSELAEMDLSDCGFIQASEDMQQNMINARKAAKDENGRGGFGWEYGGVDTPCTALGTGLVSDLDAFCLYSNPGYDQPRSLGFTTSGRPMCLGPEDERDESWWSGTGLQLTWACTHAYPGGEQPFLSGELWPIIKYGGGSLECFYYRQRPDTEAPEVFTEVET